MEEQLISFETAKLAKEKGFRLTVSHYWNNHGNLKSPKLECRKHYEDEDYVDSDDYNNITEYGKSSYSAPTQSLLKAWIREKHRIFIIDRPTWNTVTEVLTYYFGLSYIPKNNSNMTIVQDLFEGEYISYEDGFEHTLQEALKLLTAKELTLKHNE